MVKLPVLITACALVLILSETSAVSGGHKSRVTPYGDFCGRISHYGVHQHMLDMDKVRESLNHYFGSKGLDFKIVNEHGRFIKAHIKDSGNIVDTIIFDRHTGRIRSIY